MSKMKRENYQMIDRTEYTPLHLMKYKINSPFHVPKYIVKKTSKKNYETDKKNDETDKIEDLCECLKTSSLE